MSTQKQKKGKPVVQSRLFSQPWPWIVLALNPVLITGGVFHPDPYIKIIFIAAVLGCTLLFYPWRNREATELSFTMPELCWLGYMAWGALAIIWSAHSLIALERWLYLLLPTAAYVVGKQTQFWRSALFWNVFTGVALVVSVIGMCMYLFAGTPFGFDWILSAGRPSSTLSYRAYAGTYLVLTLPFLAWFMASRFVRSVPHFVFVALSFVAASAFLVYTRARSEWLGIAVAFVVMAGIAVVQRRLPQVRFKPLLAGAALLVLVLSLLPPSAAMLQNDSQYQKLEGTGKESVAGALSGALDFLESGGDRGVLWGMARSIAFEPTVQGHYEGPMGTPHWVFGTGLGQYPILTAPHGYIAYILGTEVHNDWLQAFLELGPVGFLLITAFAASLLVYAWKARHKGVMIAALGGLVAWIFSTQTDFVVMRVYGVVWIAAIAAIVHGESSMPTLLRVPMGKDMRATGRKLWGLVFVWIAVAYGITMSADNTVYTALVNHDRPLGEVVNDVIPAYERGMGKYLLFTGFSQLSSTLAGMNSTDKLLYDLQEKVSLALLAMHPTNIESLMRLRDAHAKRDDYAKFVEVNGQYLQLRPKEADAWRLQAEAHILLKDTTQGFELMQHALSLAPKDAQVLKRMIDLQDKKGLQKEALKDMATYIAVQPDDITMRLYKSQTELLLGDSATAAHTAYEALQRDSATGMARQFWLQRIDERFRNAETQKR